MSSAAATAEVPGNRSRKGCRRPARLSASIVKGWRSMRWRRPDSISARTPEKSSPPETKAIRGNCWRTTCHRSIRCRWPRWRRLKNLRPRSGRKGDKREHSDWISGPPRISRMDSWPGLLRTRIGRNLPKPRASLGRPPNAAFIPVGACALNSAPTSKLCGSGISSALHLVAALPHQW